jgi:hypothetical protein
VQQGIRLDHHVNGPGNIMLEARQGQISGSDASAHDVLQLNYADIHAGFGQVGGNDQPVMPAPDNDYIMFFHGGL